MAFFPPLTLHRPPAAQAGRSPAGRLADLLGRTYRLVCKNKNKKHIGQDETPKLEEKQSFNLVSFPTQSLTPPSRHRN